MIKHAKKSLSIISTGLILGMLLLALPGSQPASATSHTTAQMSGWGWSQVPGHTPAAGLGWISFNSSNAGAGGSYAVTVDTSTGAMSGYAWTLHGYSLSFNSADLAGCPTAPCTARYNPTTHSLSGWAKFLYTGEGGGWTGWLDLSGVTGTMSNGTVTFSGNAWGGHVAGNVSFSGVTLSTPVSQFDYSLSNSGSVDITKSSSPVSGQTTITKTLLAGESQGVDLDVSSSPTLPSGVSYSITSRDCGPNCSSTMTFTVSSSAASGTYRITLTGRPVLTNTPNRTTEFNLIIRNSTTGIVSCVASPASSVKVGQAVRWTANVSGGTAPYTYTWAGTNIPTDPAPTSNPYTITYTTVGRKTAQATVRDANGSISTCNPPGTVMVNLDPKFEEF